MRALVLCLIQVIACSGILYGYYHFFLRNKKFHSYNRFFLLAAMIISLAIPFLQIPVYFTSAQASDSYVYNALRIVNGSFNEDIIVTANRKPPGSFFSAINLSYIFYATVAFIVLSRLLIALFRIKRLLTKYPSEKIRDIRLVNTAEPDAPFSFFRYLFWNKRIELDSEKGQQVFRHEWFHISRQHTLDILLMELITVVFWINPFFHLIKREVKAIHEFLADEFAIRETGKWGYAELLLQHALQTDHNLLVNPFFHNQIKRRIAMITSLSQKTSYQYLRKVMVLPVAAIAILLFAFKLKEKEIIAPLHPDDPVTIVIDPGHGGTDPGVKSTDGKYTEAVINLEIAKTIKELAPGYNVKIVMTREDANFPGNAANKVDGLKKRTEISSEVSPAAFLSIHVNATAGSSENSGFGALISGKNDDHKNALLASALLGSMEKVYKTDRNVKKVTGESVWVLDKNEVPAVILECGYINNPDDLAFISNKENQIKIAKSILEGLISFSKTATGERNPVLADTIPQKNKPVSDKVFAKVDIDASFPGGEKQWAIYLRNQLNADIPSKNGAPTGTYPVVVQFIVGVDGSLSDMRAKTQYGYGMEEEVIRVLAKGPKWRPAIQNGKEVNSYRTQPVTFVVPRNDEKDNTGNRDKIVFTQAEIPASYIGGQEAWSDYLRKNLNANVPIDSGAAAGTYAVKIQFIVKTDGTITDIKPLTRFGYGMEDECMRVIKNVKEWQPAVQNGKKVNAYKQQPITFVIEEQNDTQ